MCRVRPFLLWLRCAGFAMLAALCACGQPSFVQREAYVFGTRVELISAERNKARAADALAEVLREFDRIHRSYHAWQASELTRLSSACQAGQPLGVSAELAMLLGKAQAYARQSGGLFDPGIGALVALWGFHADTFVPRLPEAGALRRVMAAAPSVTQIVLEGTEAQCRNRAVVLDFGGLAKGWALDRAAGILRAHGIHNALINIGGNVMALGQKGDVPWQIGIQDPRGSGAMARLVLRDGEAIGTSGDYQRFFELDGRRYSHLIDPRTGQPVTATRAVTILVAPGEDAGMRSDVGSKPVFVAGKDWRRAASDMGVSQVLRIDAEGRIEVTRDMLARLSFLNDQRPDRVLD